MTEPQTRSHEARLAIDPATHSLREQVFSAIQEAGGATDAEIQSLTGLDGSTQRPRRGELVTAGRVRALTMADRLSTGVEYKRKTRTGRFATVWVVV